MHWYQPYIFVLLKNIIVKFTRITNMQIKIVNSLLLLTPNSYKFKITIYEALIIEFTIVECREI